MALAGRFLIAEVIWAAGLFAVLLAVGIASSDAATNAQVVRWLARAAELAAFPAGIAIAPLVLRTGRPWHATLSAAGIATVIGAAVIALSIAATPSGIIGDDWETRNHAAWAVTTPWLAGLTAVLYAAIGAQVGIWAAYSVPRPLQRPLFWAVGLGLLVSGFVVFDTTYETFVLHTNADASPAAFYTVLVPLSICAGLGLPTLGLVRHGGTLQT
jgi:hypothetical protein